MEGMSSLEGLEAKKALAELDLVDPKSGLLL